MPTDQNFDYADRDGLIQQVIDLNAEIDSLNDEIGRLQERCLEFVNAEEAATWPEGTPVLAVAATTTGAPFYFVVKDSIQTRFVEGTLGPVRGFARLPDALPEVER